MTDSGTQEEVKSTAIVAIPIIIAILLVLALIVGCMLIAKGLCCECCYDKVDRIKKYQKKPGQNNPSADSEQPGQ